MNYAAAYRAIVERARIRGRPEGYSESHHVVPLCQGGPDMPDNIVHLTAREHYIAHQLLVKMNPDHYGLCYAAMLMTRVGRGNGRSNNRYYEWLKIRFSNLQSERAVAQMAGQGNPSTKESVKLLRKQAWSGKNNPSFRNPNWVAINAAANAVRGSKQSEQHINKKSASLKRYWAGNPDKHPMKNPETVAKAVAARRATFIQRGYWRKPKS